MHRTSGLLPIPAKRAARTFEIRSGEVKSLPENLRSCDVIDSASLSELAALVGRHASTDGIHETSIAGLHCLRMSDPSKPIPTVYNPSLCVVVQGSKQVLLENEIYHYRPTHYL